MLKVSHCSRAPHVKQVPVWGVEAFRVTHPPVSTEGSRAAPSARLRSAFSLFAGQGGPRVSLLAAPCNLPVRRWRRGSLPGSAIQNIEEAIAVGLCDQVLACRNQS